MHKWTYLHHNATDMRTLLMNLIYQKSLRLAIAQENFGDGSVVVVDNFSFFKALMVMTGG